MARGKKGQCEIKKRGKYWQVQVTVSHNADGSPIRKTLYGKTKNEVENKLTELKYKVSKGLFINDSNMTTKEWFDKWLNLYN